MLPNGNIPWAYFHPFGFIIYKCKGRPVAALRVHGKRPDNIGPCECRKGTDYCVLIAPYPSFAA